jgi:hypothetical protein
MTHGSGDKEYFYGHIPDTLVIILFNPAFPAGCSGAFCAGGHSP